MSEDAVNINVVEDTATTDNPDIGNSVTWDDLESLTETKTDEEVLSDAKQEESKKEAKQDQPPLEPTSEEETNTEEKEITEETSEDSAEVAEYKMLKAYVDDTETEIASNTLFPHKVDGEEVEVSVQELLNNYSGKVPYDKKFQEFSTEKQKFEKFKAQTNLQIDQVNNYINGFASKMKDNDALGAMTYLAEFAGLKPHDFKRQLIEQVIPEVQRISNMSKEQYEMEIIRAENEYLLQKEETEKTQRQQQQSQKELLGKVKELQEVNGFTNEDFDTAYQDLQEAKYEGEITPEVVNDYCLQVRAFKIGDEIINKVDPSLLKSEVVRFDVQKLVLENPDMSPEEYTKILKAAVDKVVNKASSTVSKKVRRGAKKKLQKEEQKYENATSFEDL